MERKIIGYCSWCEKPVYEDENYFVTVDDKVVHDECKEDYIWELYQ